jgi:hypothetical protein
MPIPDELPTTLQRCDPERDGCGTAFSVTLDACPHCSIPAAETTGVANEEGPPNGGDSDTDSPDGSFLFNNETDEDEPPL